MYTYEYVYVYIHTKIYTNKKYRGDVCAVSAFGAKQQETRALRHE